MLVYFEDVRLLVGWSGRVFKTWRNASRLQMRNDGVMGHCYQCMRGGREGYHDWANCKNGDIVWPVVYRPWKVGEICLDCDTAVGHYSTVDLPLMNSLITD